MIPILLSITQGDYGFTWNFTLTDAQGNAIDLTSATSLVFECQLDSDPLVQFAGSMTVVTAASGTCKYVPQSTDFATAGTYNATIKVSYGTGEIITFPGEGYITVNVQPKLPVT